MLQGWRISMEDAHTHILKLAEDPSAMFFGVYDGHGGAKIAAHVSRTLHKHILERPEYKEGNIKDAAIKVRISGLLVFSASGHMREFEDFALNLSARQEFYMG